MKRAFHRAQRLLDGFFGVAANPLRELGALGFWLFWTVVASGIYVYILYETGAQSAYASVAELSKSEPHALMRSLHRYASDAFVLVTILHLVRELAYRRYRGFRWFSWTTGVPLVWLVLASGIIGYWLVSDTLAQFIGVAASEALAVLPGFDVSLVRNFIAPDSVSDRFFSLLAFMHIAVSLLLLLGMWLHIQRIARARVQPASALAWGTLAALLILALVKPALLQPRADPAHIGNAQIDWFFVFPLVISDAFTPATLWLCAGIATVLVCVLPWWSRGPRASVAVVDPEHCIGCGRCADDCPYAAIIVERGAKRAARAQVIEDLCAGCGICVGACPSSTPFRSIMPLKSGIEIPHAPIAELHANLDRVLHRHAKHDRIVVFGCDHGAHVATLARSNVITSSLPCLGMLPPSFIDYALRRGAAAVVVAPCSAGDCEFRLGDSWIAARVSGEREPRLRANDMCGNVLVYPAMSGDEAKLVQTLDGLRKTLRDRMHEESGCAQRETALA